MFPCSNCESSQNGQGVGGALSATPPPPLPNHILCWKDKEGQTNFGMHGVAQGQVRARLACYIFKRETL